MSHRSYSLWSWIRLVALCVCLPIGACNCNKSADEGAKKDADKSAEATEPEKKEDSAAAETYPEDLYQDFNFAQFSQEERGTFVGVAKAELCPCPDANTSLHECLKTRETRCSIAEQEASMIGQMIKADFNQTDILDKIAEFVEAVKKKHDFDLKDRPVKGNPDAAVVVVEFADFQCPYCKEASKFMKKASQKYGDKIAIYYKNFPLSAHPFGPLAARAGIAAHMQGKFWKMHDLLFEHQKTLNEEKIIDLARRAGLNVEKFKRDLASPEVRQIVAKDKSEGESAGISGTPTIFINGRRFLGDGTEEGLFEAIEAALKEAKETKETTDTTN
jgi:protein-disulfide isomerase